MLINASEHLSTPTPDREHKGIVVDNRDPKRAGRVRALVEGRYEVPADQYDRLPWIYPNYGAGAGGRTDSGSFAVPEIRAEIKVRFVNNDPYFATYTTAFESRSQHTAALFDQNYPNVSGSVDRNGLWNRVDRQENSIETFRGTVGDLVSIDREGNWTIRVPKNLLVKIDGKADIQVQQALTMNLLAALNIKSATYTHSVGGAVNVRAGGAINTDGSARSDQTGAADVSAVDSAISEINSSISALGARIQELTALSDSVRARGAAANNTEFEQGIPVPSAVFTPTPGGPQTPEAAAAAARRDPILDAIRNGPAGSAFESMLASVPALGEQLEALQEAASTVTDMIADSDLLAGITETLTGITERLEEAMSLAQDGLDWLQDKFEAIGDAIMDIAGEVWDEINAMIDSVMGSVTELLDATGISDTIDELSDKLGGYQSTLGRLNTVPGLNSGILSCIDGRYTGLLNQIANARTLESALQLFLTPEQMNKIYQIRAMAESYKMVASIASDILGLGNSLGNIGGLLAGCSITPPTTLYQMDTIGTRIGGLAKTATQFRL